MKNFAVTLWGLVIIALVIIGPLLTLWALNTLFPSLAIPYTLETWGAIAVIQAWMKASGK